ncbi:hypothetical protein Moror_8702 [Moniliophthora roreri MCA 2997]|uniref:Uncharacterized protein n=2 Tax=Moniliophthora roreri TaxID=221103 RepID=V2YD03_MONRO|nr:hypothetical protein Moror_8702 [Moniliophthora roreri MCA 2997]KAI3602189.1 hypothetical protein WG66_002513 [Moniliophthora roreri]
MPTPHRTRTQRLQLLWEDEDVVQESIKPHSVVCARCDKTIKLDSRPKSGAYYRSNWLKHRDSNCRKRPPAKPYVKARAKVNVKAKSGITIPIRPSKECVSSDTSDSDASGPVIMAPRRVTKNTSTSFSPPSEAQIGHLPHLANFGLDETRAVEVLAILALRRVTENTSTSFSPPSEAQVDHLPHLANGQLNESLALEALATLARGF